MFWTKLKIALTVLLVAGVIGTIGGALVHQALAKEDPGARNDAANNFSFTDADKPETDKEKLQGTWIAESFEEGGKKAPEEEVKSRNTQVIFAGDKVTLPIKGEGKAFDYKLDQEKKPKEIDVLHEKGKTAKGIYQVKGDTLELCLDKGDGERPTEFASKEGTTHVLIVLKRKK
jgi:uncharacterized protein (TIGR03067 family)